LPMSNNYGRLQKIDKQTLQEMANGVESLSQLVKKLGYAQAAGGAFSVTRKYLQKHEINTSHWTGSGWSKGKQLKDWNCYNHHQNFKKHLISKKSHQCENCELKLWKTLPIPLEVHHIDGDKTNNNYENLQLLCPNCHALTDSWRGRNIKE